MAANCEQHIDGNQVFSAVTIIRQFHANDSLNLAKMFVLFTLKTSGPDVNAYHQQIRGCGLRSRLSNYDTLVQGYLILEVITYLYIRQSCLKNKSYL